MMVGFYSYIADITTEKERTVRIGIISLVYSVGVPFGMAFSGILIRYVYHIVAASTAFIGCSAKHVMDSVEIIILLRRFLVQRFE